MKGVVTGKTTLDAAGVDLGDADPFGAGGGSEEGASQSRIDAMVAQLMPGYGGATATLDGFSVNAAYAFGLLASGAAMYGPAQTVYGIYSRSQGKYVGLATWDPRAAQDGVVLFGRGSAGFLPVGTKYQQGVGLSGSDVTRWLANYGVLGEGPHQDFISTTSLQLAAMLAQVPSPGPMPPGVQNLGGFQAGRFSYFSESEVERLKEAFNRITSEKCRNWINEQLKKTGKTLDDLLKIADFNKYSPSLTAEQMGISEEARQEIRNNYEKRFNILGQPTGAIALAVTNQPKTYVSYG